LHWLDAFRVALAAFSSPGEAFASSFESFHSNTPTLGSQPSASLPQAKMASAKGKGLAAVIKANPSFVNGSQATTESSYDGNAGGGVCLREHPDPTSPPEKKLAPFEEYAAKQRGEAASRARGVNQGNQSKQAASAGNKSAAMSGAADNGKGRKKQQQQSKSAMKGSVSAFLRICAQHVR
jgi:hypothetical protein